MFSLFDSVLCISVFTLQSIKSRIETEQYPKQLVEQYGFYSTVH